MGNTEFFYLWAQLATFFTEEFKLWYILRHVALE